ncbi:5-beta-cholestane-3-alpha,7-alpha-diol 12-alpha-hydroxylase-like [Zootoca vivipara]|uniref:5-beta-cholestane-3-alpha,7-alpha-diol 12-alpha-hydroxylase-like n=1 Tax=Zootoca vivipara TaxID=8524 RepID=UPI001592061A|nr:5-beta-cholestane-3-alpha,7-alpha-diol 12-alpha-hydroxylase-like [Zootoca vivipara]
MAFWVIVLFAVLACILGGLYLVGAFRQRRAQEPPLDKGLIPWLGHALSYRKDSVDFLQRMQKKHGDIFTVLFGGYYFTFLMDPLSYGAIVKEARTRLDLNVSHFVAQVFGFQHSEMTLKILETVNTKHLRGNGLVVMTQAMMESLHRVMRHSLSPAGGQKSWKQDGLFHFSYNMLFKAGYLAVFGNAQSKGGKGKEDAERCDLADSEDVFVEFCKFDSFFPGLASSTLSPREKKEAESLKRHFWNIMSVKEVYKKENISGWITDLQEQLDEAGTPEYMQGRLFFTLLWGFQANSGPASFWLLAYLLKNPKAMDEVRKEVDRVVGESGQEVRAGGAVLNVTKEMLDKTPILDSAVEETLRLTTIPLLTRVVVVDLELKMNDGRQYLLRKGDRVALFPFVAAHMDPEIHPDPHVFKYDRFLSLDGTKKRFYKNGEKVKYFSMPWGVGSMCPGRYFATNQLKLFAFLMLTYFDMQLVNMEEEFPPVIKNRCGVGVMQPTHDVQFRYRLRH